MVRLIDESGEQMGEMPAADALAKARQAELDLVEVAPNSKVPVCRIMDYGKYMFQQGKKTKSKGKKTTIKQINFRPGTEKNDYEVKLKKIRQFLQGGDKVKTVVRFRGREMQHQDLGIEMLQSLQQDLHEYGTVEQVAKVEGRQGIMVLAPVKVSK